MRHALALALAIPSAIAIQLTLSACASPGSVAEPVSKPIQPVGGGVGGGPVRGGSRSPGLRTLEEAKILARKGDLAGAIQASKRAIEEDSNMEEAFLLLGSCCAMTEDAACEAKAYDDGLAALPQSAAMLSARGLLRLRANNHASAIEDLEAANNLTMNKDAKMMADLSYAYIFANRLDEAELMAQAARRLDPKSPEAAMSHGEILLREAKGAEAAEAFGVAAALLPSDLALKRRQGLALMMDGRHQEALVIYEALDKTEQGGTKDASLLVQIAGAQIKLDRAADAVRTMKRAVELDPRDVKLLALLLSAQEKASDRRGAESTKKRLKSLGAKP